MVFVFPKREIHGGTGKREREKSRKNLVDFSASTNPFPPQFKWSCDPPNLAHYPDDTYFKLKERISQTFHRSSDEICVGNGSIEIIRVFCQVALKGSKKTFFTETPTFGEYELSARLSGAKRIKNSKKADVSFVCNPNNPTGILQKKQDLLKILKKVKSPEGLLFCDEAFIELSDPSQSMADVRDPNLFVLHSLTKSFSIPGIRFGYGFGDPSLIDKIEIARPPWSVNAFAEAFALEAFRHMDQLSQSRAAIEEEREWLTNGINALGLHCHPSSVNFILVDCGRDVTTLCTELLCHNILVRNCTSFGLPSFIRVAVRTTGGKPASSGGTLGMHALIMAGGAGSRINLGEKPLVSVCGRPMIAYILDAFIMAGINPVVAASSKTPMTMNWCRAHGIDVVRTEGRGYIHDMIDAVKTLDEQHRLFICVSDIPCITTEIIQKIAEVYRLSGKDACSTWIPAQVVQSFHCSIMYREKVHGVDACPTGVNILRGDHIAQPQDELRILLDEPGLALNVNTRKDLAIAEGFLKHKFQAKSTGI